MDSSKSGKISSCYFAIRAKNKNLGSEIGTLVVGFSWIGTLKKYAQCLSLVEGVLYVCLCIFAHDIEDHPKSNLKWASQFAPLVNKRCASKSIIFGVCVEIFTEVNLQYITFSTTAVESY